MVGWKFKSCPRCNGDCYVDSELDKTWFMECIQCGWRKELKDDTKERNTTHSIQAN